MSKQIGLIVGVIVLVLAVGGGAFYGGMLFERTQVNNTRAQFLAARGGDTTGLPAGGGPAGGGFFGGGGGGGGGRGANGQIKSIDGDTLTISTPQSVVTVKLTAETQILKSVPTTTDDLQVGTQVVVRGQADSAGVVTAQTIQLPGQTLNAPTP